MLYFPLQFNFWLKNDAIIVALLILRVVLEFTKALLHYYFKNKERGLGEQSACFLLKYNDSTWKGSALCF